jgi:hypothetical protein
MAIKTRQQIAKIFDACRDASISFNSEVIKATGLLPKQIFLKVQQKQIPCIIYSCSMTEAKVIANLSPEVLDKIRAVNNSVMLRFAFKREDKHDPLKFFVGAKITGFNPYNKKNPHTNFISLSYTQKPPDDLIKILGAILEVKKTAQDRKEERIVIDYKTSEKIGLIGKASQLIVNEVPRKCIIRDLSLNGAKVLIVGLARFLLNKEAVLKVRFNDIDQSVIIPGKIIRYEEVKGRKDIAALAIQFKEADIPLTYTKKLNLFFI